MVVLYLGLRTGPVAGRARIHPEARRLLNNDAELRLLYQKPRPDEHQQCFRQRHEGGSRNERKRDQSHRHSVDRRLRRGPDPLADRSHKSPPVHLGAFL